MRRPAIVVILLAAATAAAAAAADPVCLDIAWNTLARSGLPYGSGVWGAATAKDGKKVLEVVASTSAIPSIATSELSFNPIGAVPATWAAPTGFKATALNSVSPDFISFHTKNGKTFAFNHFEYPQPSKMYVSELSKPDAKGKITVVNTKPLDDTKDDGLIFMCSGTMTPWGSHLGGEEYAPDCRLYEQTFAKCVTPSEATQCGMAAGDSLSTLNLVEFARYYGLYSAVAKYNLASVDILNNQAAHDKFVELYKCYNYGSSPEAKLVSSTGTTSLTKWRTLGRMSHETALVMPDRKTVYSTDDHPNGVWLKFVADKKQKLDSGSLYAAKLKSQRVENGKPTWDLEWILLGKGNQAALETIAESNMKFSDIFEVATPTGSPPACPTGFTAAATAINFARVTVNSTNYFIECLKVG
ncbi:hypothetical protein MNEG_4947 [Monoraphidium neglectum]|uniref:Alkaline phosphatase n=1 Tax=Monoraphidium neglectum TaxID=145388 RepID=A0A0D2NC49_9CHLO|nr:hypothetical protein MNEG_4947 [Monoraphidium neglectum]KIZ03011.1 hypothetical protein MNEG_4947 [Monoraphidium neglectum]|eukprot:XP_013902030.1 hypothetical protein MNEG_4947 [Monoraphidium neglectum]